MGRIALFLPVLAAGVALAGCTGVPVRTDQNAQLLATVHCQSVGWAGGFKGDSPLRNTVANPLNEARLRQRFFVVAEVIHHHVQLATGAVATAPDASAS